MDFLITSEISVWDLPPWWLHRKEASCSVGELGSVPGSGRFPGGEHGNPLQYFCLENLMVRGAWWATFHGVTESDVTEQLSTAHIYLRWLNHVLQNLYVEAPIPTWHYLATYALSHSLDLICSCLPHSASATLAFLGFRSSTRIYLCLTLHTHIHTKKDHLRTQE